MINDKKNYDTNAQTANQIANQSFDQTYQVSVVEPLTLNPVTNALERQTAIQGNASQVITPVTDGDVTTTTILKTIGTTVYTKTIAKNNVTGVVTISEWS